MPIEGRVAVVTGGGRGIRDKISGPGSVSVIDLRQGRVLHTVAVSSGPEAVALDIGTGHLFVASSGALALPRVADDWAWMPGWLRQHVPFLPPPRRYNPTVPATVSVLDTARL